MEKSQGLYQDMLSPDWTFLYAVKILGPFTPDLMSLKEAHTALTQLHRHMQEHFKHLYLSYKNAQKF